MTDGQYLQAHLHGDPDAFAQLVARHAGMVHGVAARGAPGQAQDVTQAVFLLLHQRARALKNRTHLAGWLYLTARLCARTAVRNETRRRKHESEAGAMQAGNPDTQDAAKLVPLLDDAVAALGRRDRDTVILHYLQNKSVAETAAALAVSESAAAKRCQRAVERLRRWFGAHGHVAPAGAVAAMLAAEALRPVPAAAASWRAQAASVKAAGLAKATHAAMLARKVLLVGGAMLALVVSGVAVLALLGDGKNSSALVAASAPATRVASAPAKPVYFQGTVVMKVQASQRSPQDVRAYVQSPDNLRLEFLAADGSVDATRPPMVVSNGRRVNADERSHLYLIEDYQGLLEIHMLATLTQLRQDGQQAKLPIPGGEATVVLEAGGTGGTRPADGDEGLKRFEVLQRTADGNKALEDIGHIYVWFDEKGVCERVGMENGQRQISAEVERPATLPARLFDLTAPAGYTDVREGIFPRLDRELREVADRYYAARDALDHYRMVVIRGTYPRTRMVRDGEQWRLDMPDLSPLIADKARFVVKDVENLNATAYLDSVLGADVKLYQLVMTYQGQLAQVGYNYSTADGGPALRAQWLVPPLLTMISTEAKNKEQLDQRMTVKWFKQAPIHMVGTNLAGDDLRQLGWPAWMGDVLVAPHGWDLGTPPPEYHRLPDRDTQPRLIGVRAIRGMEATDYWIDPERDYLCVEYDAHFDPEAPWQKNPATWNPAEEYARQRPVTPKGDPSRESQKIVEFGRTPAGKWYPKRMTQNRSDSPLAIVLDTPEKIDDAYFQWPEATPLPGTTPTMTSTVVMVGTAEAQEMDVRQKTETNMRQILTACSRYRQRQNKWPENLQVLVDENYLTADTLINPRNPDARPGFNYKVSGNRETKPMLWENFARWPTKAVGKEFPSALAVGHYGNVKWVKSEEELQTFLQTP